MRKLHFEDHGQDFLSWTVDDLGTIIEVEPYNSAWLGQRVLAPRTVRKGHLLNVRSKSTGDVFAIVYPVERIQVLNVGAAAYA